MEDKGCLLDEYATVDMTVDRGALCVERWVAFNIVAASLAAR